MHSATSSNRAHIGHWADLKSPDFLELDRSRAIAVLPLGATEQHGPHLPLSVDSDLAQQVLAGALELARAQSFGASVLALPLQPVGFSPEHAKFAGTLSLRSTTLIQLWTELGEAVHASGVNKLVLFNAHGGQVGALDLVARDLRNRLGMLVVSVNWFGLPLGDEVHALFSAHEHRFGSHAGDIETSMMLAIKPGLVDMAAAQHFASTSELRAASTAVLGNGKSAKLAWQMQDINPAGAAGNAAAATAAKGQAVIDAAAASLCQLFGEIDGLAGSTLRG
ncbi:creatininase family protein [Comamonadaceae bacterium M7527]|nr:creatininase family protein [Comamonadaceae bacterium M7527]